MHPDERVRRRLLALLADPEPGEAPDEVTAGFWARARARAAGASVPFDAAGLERLRSKV